MKIEFSYQTQDLPPPYAFAASFELNTSEDGIETSFQIEYLGREELSEEEITDQGFTTKDDFHWKGNLGTNWISVLERFNSFKYQHEPLHSSYLHVTINDLEKGFPAIDEEVMIQELLQAVLESAKKELPLKIQLCSEKKEVKTLLWNFSERQFTIENHSYSWERSSKLMNILYTIEFDDTVVFDGPEEDSIRYQDSGKWLKINDKSTVGEINNAIRLLKE